MKCTNLISLCAASVVFIAAFGALAAGDIAKGERLAKQCTVCHTLNKGGKNKLGPNLFGILGSSAASVNGYKYSKAMASSGIIWDEVAFIEFLTRPKKFLKGTKMSYFGLKKAAQRADLLAYFKTLTDAAPNQMGAGDAVEGKVAAVKQCKICHSFDKGGKLVFGPNLFGVYGKVAGSVKGYNYSKALSESGLTWTEANLSEFLANPEQFVKRTKANFPGVKSAKKRADIVAYLRTLK